LTVPPVKGRKSPDPIRSATLFKALVDAAIVSLSEVYTLLIHGPARLVALKEPITIVSTPSVSDVTVLVKGGLFLIKPGLDLAVTAQSLTPPDGAVPFDTVAMSTMFGAE
jgi:hypothetical protein